MKLIITAFFILASPVVFSQKRENYKTKYGQLQLEYKKLEEMMLSQKNNVETLVLEMNYAKELSANAIEAYRLENEKLREIMRTLVSNIDELNTLNLKLEQELEECKSGK